MGDIWRFLSDNLQAPLSILLLQIIVIVAATKLVGRLFVKIGQQIGLLNDWHSWLVCLGVIAVAIIGKLGGSMVAARWTGMIWPDSFLLGALMNTRGLMELIVLNIGYDLALFHSAFLQSWF
jgi:Kef-type K+ transport system membrane component KefB